MDLLVMVVHVCIVEPIGKLRIIYNCTGNTYFFHGLLIHWLLCLFQPTERRTNLVDLGYVVQSRIVARHHVVQDDFPLRLALLQQPIQELLKVDFSKFAYKLTSILSRFATVGKGGIGILMLPVAGLVDRVATRFGRFFFAEDGGAMGS